MRYWLCFILLLFWQSSAQAFDASNNPWLSGETEFKAQLFNSPPPDPKFQAAFIEALNTWTNNSTFKFTVDPTQAADPCANNGLNGISFEATNCGMAYGSSTLAVQSALFSGNVRTRSVITFNSAVNWDVFNGFKFGFTDFRRVAVHELGHSLGLGHEDTPGVSAIMASIISSIEQPTADDIAGVAFMYDSDGDQVGIADDNCDQVSNPDQADQDSDGKGNACDPDKDNDGVFDSEGEDQTHAVGQLTSSGLPFGASASNRRLAQSFVSSISGDLVEVRMPIFCGASPPTNIRVSITNVNSLQRPTGGALVSVLFASIPQTQIDGFVRFDLSNGGNPLELQANQSYAITVESNGACFWTVTNATYSFGQGAFSNNNGPWFTLTDDDLPFVTVIDPKQVDNCPLTANADQADADGDQIGDVCEDQDGDGVDDPVDNCIAIANPDQADLDNDNLGDVCDDDDDGDGVEQGIDSDDRNRFVCSDNDGDQCDDCANGLFNPNNDGTDTDGNGICNLTDPDDDGDGVNDNVPDNCPVTPNPDQADSDNNGIGDACQDDSLCVPIKANNNAIALVCL